MNKIILTELRIEDSPILFKWINDRSIVILNNNYSPVHETNHDAWFTSIVARSDIRIFAIRKQNEENIIGTCQLFNIDYINRNAELQIRIAPEEQRGKGYGRQAIQLLLDYAFKDLGLHRVFLRVFSTNENAIKDYKKIGFSTEGVMRDASYIDGKFVDIIIMAILKSEYTL